MQKYHQKILEHIARPRNLGKLDFPDGVGTFSNPECGDSLTVHINVDDHRISDIAFSTMGCGSSIAVTSMLTELARGKTIDEALQLSDAHLAESLGLPVEKVNCAKIGSEALKMAISDFLGNGAS